MKTVRFDVVSTLFSDTGDKTSVALTLDNLVIEVHESENEDTLYYTLGKLDVGVPERLKHDKVGDGRGRRPCVAACSHDQSLAVVEVHERGPNTLGYRVGVIKGKNIEWKEDDTEYDKGGFRPSIALDGLRAVGVHQVFEGSSDLYYKLGRVDPKRKRSPTS